MMADTDPRDPIAPTEEPDGQMEFTFPEPSRKVNLGDLVPKGVPVKLKRKQKGKTLKADGAIPDPNDTVDLINEQVLEDINISFKRDEEYVIEEATVTFTYGVRGTWMANSDAGRVAMGLDA
jgi:hypothetical protein